jgi:hypothetical protein
LGEIIARAAIAARNALVPMFAHERDLLPLSALTAAGMSLAALRQAAIRGRLEASRDSCGQWCATREAVETYKNSRQRRHQF